MESPAATKSAKSPAWTVLSGAVGTYALLFAVSSSRIRPLLRAVSRGTRRRNPHLATWRTRQRPAAPRPPLAHGHHSRRPHGQRCDLRPMLGHPCRLVRHLGRFPGTRSTPCSPSTPLLYITTGQQWVIRLFGVSYFLLLINLYRSSPSTAAVCSRPFLGPQGLPLRHRNRHRRWHGGALVIGLFALFHRSKLAADDGCPFRLHELLPDSPHDSRGRSLFDGTTMARTLPAARISPPRRAR